MEKKSRKKGLLVLLIIVIALAAGYIGGVLFFKSHFLPNTMINGVNCGGKTTEEAKALITDHVTGYEMQIEELDERMEIIRGTDFGLTTEFGGQFDSLLGQQNGFTWPAALLGGESHLDVDDYLTLDQARLQEVLLALDCMDAEKMTQSANAYMALDENGVFQIQPAYHGTYLQTDAFLTTITDAVYQLQEHVSLQEAGLYTAPAYTEESEETKAACDKMNQMLQTQITYDMIDIDPIVISKEEMGKWLTVDEQMQVIFDEEGLEAFVEAFAEKYDTYGKEHSLKTTWGQTVTTSRGRYGWKLDQDAEIAALKEELTAMEAVMREPKYSSRAKSHGANDYGNTYVEINLTAQKLYFYKNGSLVTESKFVSGNVAKGWSTPTGINPLSYKQKNAVLRGDNYATPVDYWMPFNGGVGMHDATWRSSFGGNIYKTSGSHGCINLPYSAAKKIFNNISQGDAVFVYQLAGTGTSSSSDKKPFSGSSKPSNSGNSSGSSNSGSSSGNSSSGNGSSSKPGNSGTGSSGSDNSTGSGSTGGTSGGNSGSTTPSNPSGSGDSGSAGGDSSTGGSSGSDSSTGSGSGSTSGASSTGSDSGSTSGGSDAGSDSGSGAAVSQNSTQE